MKKINTLVSLLLAFSMIFSIVSVGAHAQTVTNSKNDVTKVAFVGDSITYGAGVKNRETEAYPFVIKAMLGDGYEIGNFGVSATSALSNAKQPYTQKDEYMASLGFGADILFIMFGTNDIKYENWLDGKDHFVSDYVAIINSYKEINPNVKVFVGVPPRIFKENVFGERSPQILENEGIPAIYEVAKEAGATAIDLFTPTKDSPELFPDFLHPNADGNKIIAEIIYNAIFAKDITAGASDWAKAEIELAYKVGIMPEKLSENYLKDITRQEFCEMVVNMLPQGLTQTRTAAFTDCNNEAVNYAYSVGVVNGVSDTSFAPDNKATREEMATMLHRAYLLVAPDATVTGAANFTDGELISDWALDAVTFLNLSGIMKGDTNGNAMPNKNTSVEEAVLLVYRTYNSAYNYGK